MALMLERRKDRSGVQRASGGLLDWVDLLRLDATRRLDQDRRSALGQFLTPARVARFVASMSELNSAQARILDAGAGVGSLTAALLEKLCKSPGPVEEVHVVAYEIDPLLAEYLDDTLGACRDECERAGIGFSWDIRREDFIEAAVVSLGEGTLFGGAGEDFDCAIMNPPYGKIRADSRERGLLRSVGIEASNLYAAFLSLAATLLGREGELVAITPRSFCNGPYFRAFRRRFFSGMKFSHVHVFSARDRAFEEDSVLQENIVFRAVKESGCTGSVLVTSNDAPGDEPVMTIHVEHDEIVRSDDPDKVVHLITNELDRRVAREAQSFRYSLNDIGLTVSTGRVVAFRAVDFLRKDPDANTVPLVHPGHFRDGFVSWPGNGNGKKAIAIVDCEATEELLIPKGTYVLTKRFTSKEQRRRVVAAVFDPDRVEARSVGFENHVNYFHARGGGLEPVVARGLAAFLNCTLVDCLFRQFSGHTQVNATDLRSLGYPSLDELERIGAAIGDEFPEQREIDRIVRDGVPNMPSDLDGLDPVRAREKMEEALCILKDLGLPREQQNERSALTLLALLGIRPGTEWRDASDPLCGITPMMEFFAEHYGRTYAPNSRETVRRYTVHQLIEAGVLTQNPDEPDRPTNSPKTVYQIGPAVLDLVRSFGTEDWDAHLAEHVAVAGKLRKKYARERSMNRIPVSIGAGEELSLSPGKHSELTRAIVEEFCPRFTPGAKVLYVGDTGEKWAHLDSEALEGLGVFVEEHGKMPDVVVYYEREDWLVLVEAVTSHGPVNPKRHSELRGLFSKSSAGLVFVTAFPDRSTLTRYLSDIAWETEVWVAEAPTHMIHFNGERFLGPYPE